MAAPSTGFTEVTAAYRAALVLHDVEGLTAAEIADATGVPLGTTKARIRRARIAMVSLLAATAEPNDRQEASGCLPPIPGVDIGLHRR